MMNGQDEFPGVRARMEERNELMRIAAVEALRRSRNGRDLDEHARAWAFWWAAKLPLGQPLSSGEPA